MRFTRSALTLTLLASAALSAFPAAAQEAGTAASDPVARDGGDGNNDYLLVGVGGLYQPSYQGSDDQVFSPIAVVQGSYHGIDINPRARGLAIDLIPDGKDAKFGFSLGLAAGLSFNRSRNIKDDVVRAAGKLDTAVELGVSGGVTAYRLLNPYDSLTLSADVMWDVNAYHGMTWSPAVTYKTPLSKGILAAVNVRALHGDSDYSRYYFSVTPEQSLASGLPEYEANAGWSSVSGGMLVGYDLSGDFTDGGFSLFGALNYTRMLNDGKDTPYTSLRGQPDQWTVGAGVAYMF